MRPILNNKLHTCPEGRLSLAELQLGEVASIVAMHTSEELAQRLAALGFRLGKPVQVMRRAWLSGPLQVRLGTTDVMLRRREASSVEVCVLAPAPCVL